MEDWGVYIRSQTITIYFDLITNRVCIGISNVCSCLQKLRDRGYSVIPFLGDRGYLITIHLIKSLAWGLYKCKLTYLSCMTIFYENWKLCIKYLFQNNYSELFIWSTYNLRRNTGKSDGRPVRASAPRLRLQILNHTGADLPVYCSADEV